MKKLIIFLALLFTLAIVLIGCGDNNPTSAPVQKNVSVSKTIRIQQTNGVDTTLPYDKLTISALQHQGLFVWNNGGVIYTVSVDSISFAETK